MSLSVRVDKPSEFRRRVCESFQEMTTVTWPELFVTDDVPLGRVDTSVLHSVRSWSAILELESEVGVVVVSVIL